MTNEAFALALAELLSITDPGDKALLVELVAEWTGGEMTPMALANRISQFVSLVSGRDIDLSNWALGTVNGGPAGDGVYPIRIQGGGTINLPSPAKMTAATQKGDPGGVRFLFSTTVTDADPGAGRLRFNHATPSMVTRLFYDNQEANGGDMTPWFATWGQGSSVVKGLVVLQQGSAGPPLVYRVTAAPIARTGYYEIPVAHVAGAALPDNNSGVTTVFSPTGDHGDSLRYGAGVPGGGLGVNGDVYLRLDTGDFYGPKTGGAWGSPVPQTTVASLLAQTITARDVANGAAATSTTNAGATATDRSTVAADKATVAADKATVAADRATAVASAATAVANAATTTADKAATGADRIVVAADRATSTTKAGEAAASAAAAAASAGSVDGPSIAAALKAGIEQAWYYRILGM